MLVAPLARNERCLPLEGIGAAKARRCKVSVKQVYTHYDLGAGPPEGTFKHCPFCGRPLDPVQQGHRCLPTCPVCGFVQYRNPAPTVSLLIVDGGMVLLGKRLGPPGKGTWSLPSGYVEYGDDFLTAAIKEAREETGLQVEIRAIVQVLSSFVSPWYHFLGLYLAADVIGGELEAGDDLEAVGWYPMGGPLPEMGFEEDVDVIELCARPAFEGLPVDRLYAVLRSHEDGPSTPGLPG